MRTREHRRAEPSLRLGLGGTLPGSTDIGMKNCIASVLIVGLSAIVVLGAISVSAQTIEETADYIAQRVSEHCGNFGFLIDRSRLWVGVREYSASLGEGDNRMSVRARIEYDRDDYSGNRTGNSWIFYSFNICHVFAEDGWDKNKALGGHPIRILCKDTIEEDLFGDVTIRPECIRRNSPAGDIVFGVELDHIESFEIVDCQDSRDRERLVRAFNHLSTITCSGQ